MLVCQWAALLPPHDSRRLSSCHTCKAELWGSAALHTTACLRTEMQHTSSSRRTGSVHQCLRQRREGMAPCLRTDNAQNDERPCTSCSSVVLCSAVQASAGSRGSLRCCWPSLSTVNTMQHTAGAQEATHLLSGAGPQRSARLARQQGLPELLLPSQRLLGPRHCHKMQHLRVIKSCRPHLALWRWSTAQCRPRQAAGAA